MNKIFEKLFGDYPKLSVAKNEIILADEEIISCYKNGGKLLVCGNGGSASDSEHIVGELMKGFNLQRRLSDSEKSQFDGLLDGEMIAGGLQKSLRAISLVSQTGLMTAFMNDCNPELVFAQQVYGYADPGDVLIALSTSGNSKNVVYAAETARAVGCRVIAITGDRESRLSEIAHVCIRLPAHTPYEVQEFTLPVYHALCASAEEQFFGESS